MPMPPAKVDWSSKWLTKTKPRRSKTLQLQHLLKRLPLLRQLLLLKPRPKQRPHLPTRLLLLKLLRLKRLPSPIATHAVRVAAVVVVVPVAAAVATIAAAAIVDVAMTSVAAVVAATMAAKT